MMKLVRDEPLKESEQTPDCADDGALEITPDPPFEARIASNHLPDVDLRLLEALLFSTHHPLTAGRLAELMGLETTSPVRHAIKELNSGYEESNRSFRVDQVAGGYQILTLPEFGEPLKKLHQREIDAKLTKSALETLAIIAYKQPILRADIEAIRGVQCGETIRNLMEKRLVNIAGRAEVPGRPILYGTTKRFLEIFGLNTLKDLPQSEDGLKPLPG
jgi:segregation and condensation protein B